MTQRRFECIAKTVPVMTCIGGVRELRHHQLATDLVVTTDVDDRRASPKDRALDPDMDILSYGLIRDDGRLRLSQLPRDRGVARYLPSDLDRVRGVARTDHEQDRDGYFTSGHSRRPIDQAFSGRRQPVAATRNTSDNRDSQFYHEPYRPRAAGPLQRLAKRR